MVNTERGCMLTFISVYSLISSIPRTYTERGYMFTFISVYSLISSIPETYSERGCLFTFISVYSLISSIPWTYSDVDMVLSTKFQTRSFTLRVVYSLVGFCKFILYVRISKRVKVSMNFFVKQSQFKFYNGLRWLK